MPFRENDTIISQNKYLHAYGKARILQIKNGKAKVEYVPHVFSRPPLYAHTKFLNLQEAERIPSPLEKFASERIDDPWKFDLRQMAARFLTENKGGQLSNTRTELLPHQIFTAYEVVKNPRRRFLLADEVGLGKTIEAGIIYQALYQRGVANRVLIVCPAGLTLQWQEEMEEKFGTFFEIFNRDFQTINPRIWDLKTTAIASIDALKRPEHKAKLLENRKWDLIIFDEAHKLSAREYGKKIDKTENYKLAEDLKNFTDALLLLSATPHQGEENHSRFINMVSLLDENIDFSSLLHSDLPLFRNLKDDSKTPYYEYILRTPKMQVTDASGHKVFRGRNTHSYAFEMFDDEKRFYQEVRHYIKRGYSYLERVTDKRSRLALGFVLSTFLKIAASSTAAIKNSLRNRKVNLEHKKQIIQDRRDEFQDERFEGENAERQLAFEYGDVFLKNEIQEIERLLDIPVAKDKKTEELTHFIDRIFQELQNPEERKIVIFTEYRTTQTHLVSHLERLFGSGCVTIINGDLDIDQRRENRLKFKNDDTVHFLVSTESGGEGINLQFSHILFNYDMPWNPMRVEQRIGRIYRYGQNKVVQIYNFRTKDTIEDKIYNYIEKKVERAAKAISRVTGEEWQEIAATMYGEMENEIDYESIYQRAFVEGDIEETKAEIDLGVKRAKKAYELATEKLFSDVSSYSFDAYEKHLKTELTLKDLEVFTREFLTRRNRRIKTKDGLLTFITPDDITEDENASAIEDRYQKVTFNREQAIDDPDLEFFGLGHPFVNAMIHACGDVSFGGFTTFRRITNETSAGTEGFQFNYIVRSRIQREAEEEFLFDMYTIFVDENYEIRDDLAQICQRSYSDNEEILDTSCSMDIHKAKEIANNYLQENVDILWDWEEDVELLNMAYVRFISSTG